MTATKNKPGLNIDKQGVLHTLTVAALALPGILTMPAYADDNDVSFQYGHYQEGKRDLVDTSSQLNPIEVDTLQGSANIKLAERIRFAFNYVQDTWSGATPISTAPVVRAGNANNLDTTAGASAYLQPSSGVFDKQFNPLTLITPGDTSRVAGKDTRLVHTMGMASPETRNQGDFKLGYDWDNAALDIGGGISIERDYESRFGNVNGRWDFNQKLTRINLGLSYTNSDTHALMDHDARTYFGIPGPLGNHEYPLQNQSQSNNGLTYINGNRQDWTTTLGLTQILNKNAQFNVNLGYTRSTGFMENPYKAVTFMFVDASHVRTDGNFNGTYIALHEQRPNERNQWISSLNYVHHIDALDAALHMDYRFFHDDWGINAHTFELLWGQSLGDGWIITPKFRYYSQTAADFYQPVFLSKQGVPGGNIIDSNGLATGKKYPPLNSNTLPSNYSSDQRLSGYGALSGGVSFSKQFAKGLNFQVGFEYYTHAGGLKLGGSGEASYADFNYYVANAAVSVDMAKLSSAHSTGHHNHYNKMSSQHSSHAPAGVMFDHSLHQTGAVMVGYRYMYNDQAGMTLHGNTVANDLNISRYGGCKSPTSSLCNSVTTGMAMHMHMLELMYAPTDWLTLMLMPQFVDMGMTMRQLDGIPMGNTMSMALAQTTGGVGDTGLYAMTTLLDKAGHNVNLSLGVSAPTGDVAVKLRDVMGQHDVLIHYGMQLGSGTWDFKPSLTYTGVHDKWLWGAQLSGIKRLERKNVSGFALGDMLQSSIWGGYNLTHWLSASVRGVYTVQGAIKNQFNHTHPTDSPTDFPDSYGGRYWDLGLGLNAVIPSGDLQGNRISFEWLQPLHDDVNGYQLERDGALSVTWGYMF